LVAEPGGSGPDRSVSRLPLRPPASYRNAQKLGTIDALTGY
jgi:hypothetical protein